MSEMSEPTDRAQLTAEARAWDELARLTRGAGPAVNWRWSIPARPERDSDMILAAGLQEVADERDRLAAALAEADRELGEARVLADIYTTLAKAAKQKLSEADRERGEAVRLYERERGVVDDLANLAEELKRKLSEQAATTPTPDVKRGNR